MGCPSGCTSWIHKCHHWTIIHDIWKCQGREYLLWRIEVCCHESPMSATRWILKTRPELLQKLKNKMLFGRSFGICRSTSGPWFRTCLHVGSEIPTLTGRRRKPSRRCCNVPFRFQFSKTAVPLSKRPAFAGVCLGRFLPINLSGMVLWVALPSLCRSVFPLKRFSFYFGKDCKY